MVKWLCEGVFRTALRVAVVEELQLLLNRRVHARVGGEVVVQRGGAGLALRCENAVLSSAF